MTDNLVLALDADQAGIKAAGRAARAALQGGLNVKVAQIPDGLDPADLILKKGVDAWKTVIRESKDIITFLLDVLEQHAKAPDAFRRSVEQIVLPFLSDVQSPIAREQYMQEIAKRLHVSSAAVQEAFAKVPKGVTTEKPVTPAAPPQRADNNRRAMQAYGILLWQQSLKQPMIDVSVFSTHLQKILDQVTLARLEALSEGEKESLRFSVADDYKETASLQRVVDELLRVVSDDRIKTEHTLATDELRKAEAAGDEEAVDILKTKIAKRRHGV